VVLEHSNQDPQPKDAHAGKVKRRPAKTIVKSTRVTASEHSYRRTMIAHEFSGHLSFGRNLCATVLIA
jgi:carbonic anhydrase